MSWMSWTSVLPSADPAADAYGRQGIMNQNGTVSYCPSDYGNFIGFTGRYHDWETGLIYFRHRYFDSGLGRFCNRDPLEYIDGNNLYAGYFIPNKKDPTGTSATITFSDGTSVTVDNAMEFVQIVEMAGPGTIVSISVYGHGSDDAQTFDPINTSDNSGSIYYNAGTNTTEIQYPNPRDNSAAPIVNNFIDLIQGKLADNASISFGGCFTAPLAKKVSGQLYNPQNYDPNASGWPGWFANQSPQVTGSRDVHTYFPYFGGFYFGGATITYIGAAPQP
jgi:RHS repeat-associated protein